MELVQLSLHEAARLVAAGDLSPVDLVTACLDRVRTFEPQINAFITVCQEAALRQAEQAEAARSAGLPLGPLHGVPIALKDLFETSGVATSAGTALLRHHIPEADATAYARLKAAGAILLGKLNLNELAVGATGENPHFGRVYNPWDRSCLSGGSSSGPAAALAAGFCFGALGTDTGGSIRVPASLCGVVGLKPTFGRVSLHGVTPLSWTLDHAGPMARTVEDVALLLQTIAGPDPDDPFCAPHEAGDYLSRLTSGVRGWRIARAGGPFVASSEPAVLQALDQAAEVFSDLGARVTEVELDWLAEARPRNRMIIAVECRTLYAPWLERSPAGLGPEVVQRVEGAAQVSATEYAAARRFQAEFRHRFREVFDSFDLLLLPATPIPAQPADRPEAMARAKEMLSTFTGAFNLAGLPALALPGGLTEDGLPLGLQLVGPAWGEAGVLTAAWAFEQAGKWPAGRLAF